MDDGVRFEIGPLDTLWLYQASIDDGAPEWLLVEAAKEIDRLRRHVRQLHRLNGWSKSKGWWCSCGASIQRCWIKIDGIQPWSPEGRKHAEAMHAEHVDEVLRGTDV